jgi:DNA-binding NarL/FixJ family response regulator
MITARKYEVLRLMAEGKSNKEIASSLLIGSRTVHLHKAMIRRELSAGRLNVHNIHEVSAQLKGQVAEEDIDVVQRWLMRIAERQ